MDECKAERILKGTPCQVRLLREKMDPHLLTEFDNAMADDTIEGTIIARVLQRHGHDIAISNLRRHRRGECLCE